MASLTMTHRENISDIQYIIINDWIIFIEYTQKVFSVLTKEDILLFTEIKSVH